MLFNSWLFILGFLPITLLVFFWLGRAGQFKWALGWLVIASLFFYGWWNPVYLILIGFSMLFNYGFGMALTSSRGNRHRGWLVLIVGVTVNLGILGYFKYANFFVDTLAHVAGANLQLDPIILPLAISFFTFQQIAYLVDAFRGEAEEHDFLQYALFVTFFPQLIAGPIVHHKEMLPQFMRSETFRFRVDDFSIGLSLFLLGLFKKVVIADQLALVANPVFAEAEQMGAQLTIFESIQGIGAYTFQLYFDFSGYSDMAIGLARMFGVKLPLNFDSPYRATSIIDFWRRWHMTLSRFLRDYVYIPLGGGRVGSFRRFTNLMTTMLLGGLWHGAGWTFVFWGGLHGIYLIVNYLWRSLFPNPVKRWWSTGLARSLTLASVMVAWVFFRADSFDGALCVLEGLLHLPATLHGRIGPLEGLMVTIGFHFDGPYFGVSDRNLLLWSLFWLAVVWYVPNTQQLFAKFEPALNYHFANHRPALIQRLFPALYWRPSLLWTLVIGGASIWALLSLNRVSEFLYFQF